ncbi:MAG TPA: PAS domain S-box protein [Vicinamibacterales bacterium]|nr:PAS domain S-box protein [Vicinamibacterales bacterium]
MEQPLSPPPWASDSSALEVALAAAQLGNWSWDAANDRVMLSEAAAAIFQIRPDRVITWTELRQLLHPDDQERARKAVEAAAHGRHDYSIEYRLATPAGVRWVAARGRPVYDTHGDLRGMLGVVQDVTREKTTEAALRESEARWRSLSDCSPVGIFVTDGAGSFTYTNTRCQAICGFTAEEGLGAGWTARIHPEDREAVLAAWRAAVSAGYPYEGEFRLWNGDGPVRWTQVRSAPLAADGGPAAIIGTVEDVTERHTAEDALRDARSRLENALTVGEIATWVWDIRHDRMFADRNLARLFGVTPEQAEGGALVHYVTAIHPDDRERVMGLVADAISRVGAYEADYRVVSPGRGTRWVSVRGRVDVDAAGAPIRMHGVLIDITERKESEERLAASERRFRDLAEAMPQLVWIASADGGAEFFNQRWTEFTGLSLQDSLGGGWARAVHPEDLERVKTRWAGAVAERRRFDSEHRFRRADGVYRWHLVRAVPVLDEGGTVVRWFGTGTDVHDAKLTEERLRAVIDATPECVKVVASDGRLLQMNAGGLGMIEAVDEASVCGASVFELVAAEHRDEWREHHRRVCSGERLSWQFEVVGLRGTRRWMETHAVPMQLAEGEWAQLAVTRDITERKQYEQERELLLEAERAARAEAERASRLKDEFLTTLSHELRTPLNAILGWSRILDASGDPGQVARGLEVITRNARVQAQIIDDLLDMSRIISGKIRLELEPLDLARIVELAVETARPTAETKGVMLHATLRGEPGQVLGDPARLQQVFWNLLSNAVKFTPQGGRIDVRLKRLGSTLEVSVTDTGEGIAPEFLPNVFDRFRQLDSSTTRRHGGLGLGLSIAKQLVESHGGVIRGESEGPGQGARFTVSLPLAEASTATGGVGEASRTPVAGAVRLDGVRVLAVDDEADARELVERVLSAAGATVTSGRTAAEAIAACDAGAFDILISDVGMPGEDGYAMLRRLRTLANVNRDILAIALTAYARPEDRERALQSGYQMHLAKPLEPAELLTAVHALIRDTGEPEL